MAGSAAAIAIMFSSTGRLSTELECMDLSDMDSKSLNTSVKRKLGHLSRFVSNVYNKYKC